MQIESFVVGFLSSSLPGLLLREEMPRLWTMIPFLGGIFNSAMVNHIVNETEADLIPNSFTENAIISAFFGAFFGFIVEFGRTKVADVPEPKYGLRILTFALFFMLVLNMINQFLDIY